MEISSLNAPNIGGHIKTDCDNHSGKVFSAEAGLLKKVIFQEELSPVSTEQEVLLKDFGVHWQLLEAASRKDFKNGSVENDILLYLMQIFENIT